MIRPYDQELDYFKPHGVDKDEDALISEWADLGFEEMAPFLAKYNDFRTFLEITGR